MENRIRQEVGKPPLFVTHFIEAVREKSGPKIAIAKLKEYKIELLRYYADESLVDKSLKMESLIESGSFVFSIERAMDLIDYYCNLYEQEIENNIRESKTR